MRLTFSILVLIFTDLTANGQPGLIQSFKQGSQKGAGNCASVAAIKVAIGKYGVGNIFRIKKNTTTNVYWVKFRSMAEISITQEEMNEAIANDKFIQNKFDPFSLSVKSYADTCFAIICKGLQNELQSDPNNGQKKNGTKAFTISDGIAKANGGIPAETAARLLGLTTRPIKPTRAGPLSTKGNIVFYNKKHAVYSSNGLYDQYGKTKQNWEFRFRQKKGCKCKLFLCGPKGAFEVQ